MSAESHTSRQRTVGTYAPPAYNYDLLSRLTSAAAPESGTTYFYYTNSGGGLCSGDPNAVCRRTDARSITTTYSYDALNRLIGKAYSDSTPPVTYAYDQTAVTIGSWQNGALSNSKGRLTEAITTSGGTTQTGLVYSYDAMGRPTNHWQCTPQNCGSSMWSTTYSYDLAGDVANWTHPTGYTITNAVSNAQRITGITSSLSDSTHPATLTQSMTYTPWGALSSLQNGCVGSGCVQRQETYVYNNRMQPVMIELGTSSNLTANYCLVYNYYSDIANPTSCALPSQGTLNDGYVLGYYYQDSVNSSLSHAATFPRDTLNRLGTAQATGNATYNLAFSYDRYGNMTCVTNGQTQGPCPNWTFNAATNRITTFTYDAAGNVLSDSAHQYTWDGEGRLSTMDGGSTASIVYDAFGQMVRNLTDSHLYNPAGQRIGKLTSGTWNWGIVPWGDVGLVKWASSETYFVHHNRLESSTMSTDHAGAVQEDMLYYPWGQAKTPSTVVDGTFATMRTLVPTAGEETLVTPNRFYSATYGRWMSPDPLAGDVTNPQSLNRYAYALNNPVTFTDPSGLGDCGGDPTFDCNGPNPGKPPDPQGNWPGGGGTTIASGADTSNSDCSVFTTNGAQCADYAGIWYGGMPGVSQSIYDPTGSASGMFGSIWGVGSGGVWNEAVPPFSGGGFGLPCDFGTCGGAPVPGGNGFGEEAVLGLGGLVVAPEITVPLIVVGLAVDAYLAYRLYNIHQAKGGKQNIPPSWVTDRPRAGESADDFARRVCTARYGSVTGCGSGPGSEFAKIRKWAQDWINKHG